MTHQLFDDFIGTPPPTSVDLDRIIATEERASARRRAYTIGGALVLSLAAVLGAAVLRPSAPPPAPGAAPRDRTPAEWSAWIDREVHALVPDLQWRSLPGATGPAGAPRLEISGGGDGGAATGFIIDGHPGVLEITVTAGSAADPPVTAKVLCAGGPDCTTSSSGTDATCVVHAIVDRPEPDGFAKVAQIRCAVPDHGPRVTMLVSSAPAASPKDLPLPPDQLVPLAAHLAVELAP
ncbi:hypothetical protein GCM10009827_005400 [Dactylosporangium maewongense]|uniref:Uncharacterized protein n=1 Tax=Dactylosporangium maewongense TaxID=634393 RepID=A0ABP4K9V5_9ACTN